MSCMFRLCVWEGLGFEVSLILPFGYAFLLVRIDLLYCELTVSV